MTINITKILGLFLLFIPYPDSGYELAGLIY